MRMMKLLGLKAEISVAKYLKWPFSILVLKGKVFGHESIKFAPTETKGRLKSRQRPLSGLTLIEILVSVILLALLMVSMGNVFVSSKKLLTHSRARITSGQLGKTFLDPLHMLVRHDTWATTSCLGTANCSNQTVTIDRDYTANYAITNNNPALNLNRVVINITWNETK